MYARIVGTNTVEDLERRNYPPCSIRVWKGGRKQLKEIWDKKDQKWVEKEVFGKDQPFEYRVELFPSVEKSEKSTKELLEKTYDPIKVILKKYYGNNCREDEQGILYFKHLNIIPYSGDPEITYYSALAPYKNNLPIHHCNKQVIHTKFNGEDNRPVPCNEPCKAQSQYHKCPLKCQEFGDFYFEILELRLANLTYYCRMHVTGDEDVTAIAQYLHQFKKEVGNIRTWNIYTSRTERYIVYMMEKRTEKNKFKKINYPVHLQFHPIWANQFKNYNLAMDLKRMGIPIPRDILVAIFGEAAIPLNLTTIDISSENEEIEEIQQALPSSNLKCIEQIPNFSPKKVKHVSSTEIELARKTWREQGWKEKGMMYMLQAHFNIKKREELPYLTKKQFNQFLGMLESEASKNIYNFDTN